MPDPIEKTDQPRRNWLKNQDTTTRRKLSFISGIIGIVLLVVLFVIWAIYAFWYQNPTKVLADAVSHATNSQSVSGSTNIAFKQKDIDFNMSFDGGYGKKGSEFVSDLNVKLPTDTMLRLKLSGIITENGDTYIKPDNLKQAMSSLILSFVTSVSSESVPEIPASASDQMMNILSNWINPVFQKIDGEWIKITAGDIQNNDGAATTYECTLRILKKAQSDKAITKQLADIYMKNQFISVKDDLGTKSGSVGYTLNFDEKVMKEFEAEIKSVKIYKDFERCYEGNEKNQADNNQSKRSIHMEVWIDQWNHQFTRLNGNVKTTERDVTTEIKFDTSPVFNKPVNVSAPTKSVPLNDIADDLMKVLQQGNVTQPAKPPVIPKRP